MSMVTCMACARRWAHMVDPDCVVCSGSGILILGRAVLSRHSPETASRAVEFALEATARDALLRNHGTPERAVPELRSTLAKLRTAGVLATTVVPGPTIPEPQNIPASELRAEAVDILEGLDIPPYLPGDFHRLQTPPIMFDPDDRPLSEGGLPNFSNAGYVCFLARAADPFDPLLSTTRGVVVERRRSDQEAKALVVAADEAATRKAQNGSRRAR